MAKKQKQELKSSGMDIPDHAIESIARCLYPIMMAYFETEEGKQFMKDCEERHQDTNAA